MCYKGFGHARLLVKKVDGDSFGVGAKCCFLAFASSRALRERSGLAGDIRWRAKPFEIGDGAEPVPP